MVNCLVGKLAQMKGNGIGSLVSSTHFEHSLTLFPEFLHLLLLMKVENATDEAESDSIDCSVRTVERKKRLSCA